jgi:membrane protein involved in colicin uptake
MSNDEYMALLLNAKDEYNVKQEQKLAEEAERKVKAEAEEKKLAEERLKLKKIREEQEAEAAKIKAEQQRVAEERQALEVEKRKAEEKEARKKAEDEKEARCEALKPDREKLLTWCDNFRLIYPKVESDAANEILAELDSGIENAFGVFRSNINARL